MSFKRISFLGLPLDVNGIADDVIEAMTKTAQLITFVGPEAWPLAKKQPEYIDSLSKMSLVLPEGSGIGFTCCAVTNETCHSFSFDMTSLALPFFSKASKAKMPIVLVGGQPRDDDDMAEKLVGKFQDLNIVATAHGFGEFEPKIAMILEKTPKAVIVSMESPRQEQFMVALKEAGYQGCVIGSGSFFSHYISNLDYHDLPKWVEEYRLTAFYKFFKKPMRQWNYQLLNYATLFSYLIHDLIQRIRKN